MIGYKRKINKKHTLADRRRFNRVLIWPHRKLNRLIERHGELSRLVLCKARQWGTLLPLRPKLTYKLFKKVIQENVR